MKSFAETIKLKPKQILSKSERTQIVKEINEIYNFISEKKLRRSANIIRYKNWLKENKIFHSKEIYLTFSKTKNFIKPMNPATIAYFLSHIKTQDLYYIKSVCADRSRREQSVGQYIMGLHKIKK